MNHEHGQGQSLAPGITAGLEPHGLITDEHELRALGKGVTNEVIENTFHVEGMETLADPDLERPRLSQLHPAPGVARVPN